MPENIFPVLVTRTDLTLEELAKMADKMVSTRSSNQINLIDLPPFDRRNETAAGANENDGQPKNINAVSSSNDDIDRRFVDPALRSAFMAGNTTLQLPCSSAFPFAVAPPNSTVISSSGSAQPQIGIGLSRCKTM